MNPFAQKIILTVLAVGIYVLSALPALAPVALLLQPLAGLIIGAAWVTKPGDGALVAEAKAARSSKRPPPPAGALLVLAVLLLGVGCGQGLSPRDARMAASQMRDDLARVGGVIEFARNAQPLLCSLQPGELCDTVTDSILVIVAAHKAAQTAVDVVEVSGVASDQIAMQVRACLEQAHALGETVKVFGKAVADAMGQERSRDSVGPVLQPPAASPGGTAAPGAAAAP